jgi:hypothetical protein
LRERCIDFRVLTVSADGPLDGDDEVEHLKRFKLVVCVV